MMHMLRSMVTVVLATRNSKCKEEAFEAFYGSHKEVKPVALDVKKHCCCVVHRVIIIFQFLIIVALVCKFM
jgi:tRNA U38,U39,U40 pseudouridine synthase TruA